MSEATIDLSDPQMFVDDAFEHALATLRRDEPVYRNPGADGGFWVITRYADAVDVLADTAAFSSEYGNMLRIRRERDPAAGVMVTVADPPQHTEIRALLNHAVNAHPLPELSARVDDVVADLLARAVAAGHVDFARDVADHLPIEVTCDFLGVPAPDRPLLARLSLATFAAEDPEFAADATADAARTTANSEIIDYFTVLARARRKNGGDDFVSLLIDTEVGGRRLDDYEIALNCFSLLLGGNETARSAAAGGLDALFDNPAEFDRLRQDPALLTRAVDEIVRWTSPVRQVLRMCRSQRTVGGMTIAPGEIVTVWLISANRDESVFAAPYRFDVGRSPNRHLGFGSAVHRCVGRGVARVELTSLFRHLIESPYTVTRCGPAVPVRSPFLSGVKRLPVAFQPAA